MTPGKHRRFRSLLLTALLLGLGPWLFSAAARDPVQLAGTYLGWSTAMYLFAAGGALVSAFSFGGDEALRPGWLLLSASYLVLVPALVVLGPKPGGLYPAEPVAPGLPALASIASGSLAVAAFVLLSRAWRASGLDLTTPRSRAGARLVALLVALTLAGPDLWERFPAAVGGDVLAAADVVTDVLDGAVFVVAVPVLQAALALGGGIAAWPWLLLTASLAAWLGYDAAAAWGEVAGLAPRTIRVADEVFRTLGAAFVLMAGIAQRWLTTPRPPREQGD
jgi:hypothetical protein